MALWLRAHPPASASQATILVAFLGFQSLDAITTHLGLTVGHRELNALMRPVMATHGELVAYVVKALAIALLLGALMLMQHRAPRIWHAFHVAAWLSALGVILNVLQLA